MYVAKQKCLQGTKMEMDAGYQTGKLIKLIKRSTLSSSEVIELLASHDTLTKKLTCDYLIDRSLTDSNLGLLTANLLLRDSGDANPVIRSSSLLALSTLPGMEEAAISSVFKAMTDSSAQVRRVAAHCCLSLHRHSQPTFLESGLINSLYEGIRDSDPIVVTNCLFALEEVLLKEGGLVINKNIAHHLLQRISQFSDCNLVYILNLLLKYTPKSEEELFKILNHIDNCFNSATPSVLVSAIKLFLSSSKDFPDLATDLLERVQQSLCKILSQNVPETCYLMLEYLESSNIDFRNSLSEHYKYFLPRAKDPSYLKSKKLQLLPLIITNDNIVDIIVEVKHYASDFQSFKAAFKCLGYLGSFNEDSEHRVFDVLTTVLKGPNDKIVAAGLECLLSIILNYKEKTSSKSNLDKNVSLCQSISSAVIRPDIQENYPVLVMHTLQCVAPFLNNVQECVKELFKQMDLWDLQTRCLFITSSATVFLYWPSIMQPIMSSILTKTLNAPEQQLVSHSTFIYAVLEEGHAQALKLLAISPFPPKYFDPNDF